MLLLLLRAVLNTDIVVLSGVCPVAAPASFLARRARRRLLRPDRLSAARGLRRRAREPRTRALARHASRPTPIEDVGGAGIEEGPGEADGLAEPSVVDKGGIVEAEAVAAGVDDEGSAAPRASRSRRAYHCSGYSA
ncbi:hypothetical protein CDD83_7547 [Cordyceps sp. RAO-2017]|nr:hypothetical protein CDD83_7547 [Cordyceps sp. RAO-2017]